jgi:hypothetical protein
MNTASAARARASINRVGSVISFRRMSATTPQTIVSQADVKATPAGYTPKELAAGITQGSSKFTVSRLDLEAAGFPVPLKKGDRVILSGNRIRTVDTVDPDHREYMGCYDVVVSGA